MWRQWLNIVGLIVGLVGVLIIFKWGPPGPTFETGLAIGAEPANQYPGTTETVAQHDQKVRHDESMTILMSRVGLGFVAVGFALQIAAAWPVDQRPGGGGVARSALTVPVDLKGCLPSPTAPSAPREPEGQDDTIKTQRTKEEEVVDKTGQFERATQSVKRTVSTQTRDQCLAAELSDAEIPAQNETQAGTAESTVRGGPAQAQSDLID